MDAQPSETPSDSASAEAAAAASDQEADTQSSYSSDAQSEDAAVPAGPIASNKKRKLLPEAAVGSMGQDSDDGVSLLRQGKCCRSGLIRAQEMGRMLWTCVFTGS